MEKTQITLATSKKRGRREISSQSYVAKTVVKLLDNFTRSFISAYRKTISFLSNCHYSRVPLTYSLGRPLRYTIIKIASVFWHEINNFEKKNEITKCTHIRITIARMSAGMCGIQANSRLFLGIPQSPMPFLSYDIIRLVFHCCHLQNDRSIATYACGENRGSASQISPQANLAQRSRVTRLSSEITSFILKKRKKER